MQSLKMQAPAKINIFLDILGKRQDGFHEIDTIMSTVNIFDELEIKLVNPHATDVKIDLSCSFEDLDPNDFPCNEKNIVVKISQLFFEKMKINAHIKIHLHKRIPWGAGLGGGSSDAATALMLLDKIFETKLENSQLAKIGAEIGSDIPFFFFAPAARCTGRGEIVNPINISQKLKMAILVPPIFCSTGQIYKNIKIPLDNFPFANIIEEKFSNRNEIKFETLEELLFNQLENIALEQFYELENIYKITNRLKNYYWKRMLSGSGSAIVFYSNTKNLQVLSNTLRKLDIGKVFEAETMV